MWIGIFIRYHVDPLIWVRCHIDPWNSMLTPNRCYRATQLPLNQQCMHECCVQSPMGSLAVADTTFRLFQRARERSRARVCLCMCGLTLRILVLAVSLTWSLACCPHHPPTATATCRRQQIYPLLGSPDMWLHCLHGWRSKLRRITIYLVYTKYILGIWHCGIYLSYDRDMTNYLSYTCHMTGIWPSICHIPVIWQVYDR